MAADGYFYHALNGKEKYLCSSWPDAANVKSEIYPVWWRKSTHPQHFQLCPWDWEQKSTKPAEPSNGPNLKYSSEFPMGNAFFLLREHYGILDQNAFLIF